MSLNSKIEIIKSYIEKINKLEEKFDRGEFEFFYNEMYQYFSIVFGKDELTRLQEVFLSAKQSGHYTTTFRGYLTGILFFLENEPNEKKKKLTSSRSIVSGKSVKIDDVKFRDQNYVFIVHGHDEDAKETVARFVSKLKLEPLILHERPSHGKTIIEKLESNAEDVSFAIVLLTPDDIGASVGSNEYKHRARQNVIYELGFFNAKLGRSKVCVLKKGDIEVLSDYLGVVYVDMDKSGGWKNQLARELRGAGLMINPDDLTEALLS